MESYGQILREAREEKNLSVEKASSLTSINRQYIEALEAEEDGIFPGEPYLIGFLRNYSDFLGTNTDALINLYRAVKIQEAPAPRELLEKKKPVFLVPLLFVLCVALLIGLGLWLYFVVLKVPERLAAQAKIVEEKSKPHQYEFDGNTQDVRLYVGDQILLPAENGEGAIVLTVSSTKGALSVLTPAGTQVVELSEERAVDVTGDGQPEIIFYVSDVDMHDGSRGAETRMLLKDKDAASITATISVGTGSESEARGDEIAVASAGSRPVIHTDNRAYPFTVNIVFRGPCVFRYRSDSKDVVDGYYKSGDTISVSNNNGFRLWASNINAMKIQVLAGLNTYDLEIGKAGEVVVEDIKWVRDNDGMYRIIVDNVD